MTTHEVNLAVIAYSPESTLSWISATLAERGGRQLLAGDGLKAFELSRTSGVDLVVLVEPLAILSAQAVCTALREARVSVPILVVGDTASATALLTAGADVVLPLESDRSTLLAQIDALMRRVVLEHSPLQVGELVLDTQARRAERAGKLISLSGTEYTLLELLMRRAGRVVSREEILEHVWPGEVRASDNVLDVYVSYLRTKVDRDFSSSLIRTVRGRGYTIAAE